MSALSAFLDYFRRDERVAADVSAKAYRVGIVGESRCQPAIGRARVGEAVTLVHEPDNPFDDRAVLVVSRAGEKLGYLPRDGWLTRVVLDEAKQISARILTIGRGGGSHLGVVLEVGW